MDKKGRIPSEELWEHYNDVAPISLTKSKLTIELQKHRVNKKQMRTPTIAKPNKRTEMYIGVTLKDSKDKSNSMEDLYDPIEEEEDEKISKDILDFNEDLSDPGRF